MTNNDHYTSIDVEGSTITCSNKELSKLTSPEGCSLNIITDKVMHISDTFEDDELGGLVGVGGGYSDDEERLFEDEPANMESKQERMKREYIMMTLNANRDPIKPGLPTRAEKFYPGERDIVDDSPQYSPLEDIDTRLRKRYAKLGDYEELLKNTVDPAFEEISPGRVYKRRLTPGTRSTIVADSIVIYNFALWSQGSGHPFDSTWLRRSTILTDLETDSILPGLLELLLTCKKGEWCEALIRPEAAFGKMGAKPRIPPNATIFCLLEVVQVLEKNKINLLSRNPSQAQQQGVTFKDFFEASDEARMRGNFYLEQKQYKTAIQRYKSGIRILEALTYKDEHEERQAMALLVKLYNNCAKSANNLNEPRMALAACKQASLISANEPKTHWNRMLAWKLKGHPDRALGCARRSIQLFHSDPKLRETFCREADKLRKIIMEDRHELNDLHRLMSRAIISPN